jgi:hypothetical protein
MWLRLTPTPLIPYSCYDEAIEALKEEEEWKQSGINEGNSGAEDTEGTVDLDGEGNRVYFIFYFLNFYLKIFKTLLFYN